MQREEIVRLLKQIKMLVRTFGSVILAISNYLQSLCKMFRVDQVANHFAAWIEITKNKEILSNIKRVTIDCIGIPEQQSIPRHKLQAHKYHSAPQELQFLTFVRRAN